MSDSRNPVTVVYVGGAGRSGSTLLERLISERHDYFAVGELRYLWRRGFARDELCSCGERFGACPFWTVVVAEALDGTDPEELSASLDQLVRVRRVAQFRAKAFRDQEFNARLSRMSSVFTRLFQSIRRISGASVIVDSSKSGPYGYFLAANPSLDVRVLHLVRDSRAVAYSWQRRKARPEATSEAAYMPTFTPAEAAQIWWEHNILVGSLRRRVPHGALLRYEDFTDREDLVSDALRQLALEPEPSVIGSRGSAHRHSVSGNPARLEKDPSEIRLDAEWLTEMDAPSMRLVTRLTAPGLLRYGYPLSPPRRLSEPL